MSNPVDLVPCESCGPCGAEPCPPLPDPAIAGLMVAGGQNAAFPNAEFSLHTWYTDSANAPMGVLPSGVSWTSSDTNVVAHLGDGVFVARVPGTATLRAEAPVEGTVFNGTLEFHVIPALEGRIAWLRQSGSLQPFELAIMDLPSGLVRVVESLGGAEAFGPPALSRDRSRVAVQLLGYRGVSLSRVHVVDLASGDVLPLADSVPGQHVSPRWSPDGTDVLFAASPGGWNIWSAPAGGGSARMRLRLDWPSPVFFDPSPSTARAVLELVDPETFNSELWHAVLDSGLAGTTGLAGGGPRLSPSDQRLAYRGFSAADGNVVLIAPGTAGPDTLLPRILVPRDRAYRTSAHPAGSGLGSWTTTDDFLIVQWSVDAWSTVEDDSTAEGSIWSYLTEIYIVSADGRYRVRLTASPWADARPDFR